jgi:hypothetical protein
LPRDGCRDCFRNKVPKMDDGTFVSEVQFRSY